jgi:hypothetical protein
MPDADLAALAAAYGYGLARDHPYNDGNRRVAFVVMAVFLGLNDYAFVASESDVVTAIVALASGNLDDETPANWIGLLATKWTAGPRPSSPARRASKLQLASRCPLATKLLDR